MVDITPYQPLSELDLTKEAKRPNLVVTGATFLSAVLFAAYGALTALYAAERADVISTGETWLPSGVTIPLTQPNYMGLSMLFSFFCIWWARSAVANDDRSNAILAQSMTLLFGFGFVVQSFYLFTLLELEPSETLAAVLIVALAGVHLVLTFAGLVGIGFNLLRTVVGDFAGERYEAVSAAAIYWTAVAAIYGVLWYTVYITK